MMFSSFRTPFFTVNRCHTVVVHICFTEATGRSFGKLHISYIQMNPNEVIGYTVLKLNVRRYVRSLLDAQF